MPTYTILGATGHTGNALLSLLLTDPTTHINAYARSKPKLLSQHPDLTTNPRVTIYSGAITDIPLLTSAISPNVSAIFCVLGMNENMPGMRVAQDMAHCVVAALCRLRNEDAGFRAPRLVFLSSASVNPRLYGTQPAFVHEVVGRAMSNNYADLARAEEYLRLHESWLSVTFVQPPALSDDVQRGHEISFDKLSRFVSYPDLAAGMIEIAQDTRGLYEGKGVSVNGPEDTKFDTDGPKNIARGLVWHFVPWAYGWAKWMGMVW